MSKVPLIHLKVGGGRLACDGIRRWQGDAAPVGTSFRPVVTCMHCRRLFGAEPA